MERNKDVSVVGIRAVWTCAMCGETAKTFQLAELAGGAFLRLPAGWHLIEDSTVCSDHTHETRD